MSPNEELPDDLPVSTMIRWIADKYNMSKADRISYKNLKKVRASYYYLHNTTDPHAGERKCEDCRKWQPVDQYRDGKAICRSCENKKTLQHYWENREQELKRRKAKNWYNKRAHAS